MLNSRNSSGVNRSPAVVECQHLQLQKQDIQVPCLAAILQISLTAQELRAHCCAARSPSTCVMKSIEWPPIHRSAAQKSCSTGVTCHSAGVPDESKLRQLGDTGHLRGARRVCVVDKGASWQDCALSRWTQ